MKPRKLLILKASDDVETCETVLIEKVAAMYDLDVSAQDIYTEHDLDSVANSSSEWDIVYACGHGNAQGLGEASGTRFFEWSAIAEALCTRLNDDAWFFLGCCHGGLDQVGYAMFCGCDDLRYVFGPRWQATAEQLACAFHALLHNFCDRQIEPIRAAKRASKAIDLTIRAFDRYEVTSTDAFLRWCETNSYPYPDSMAYTEWDHRGIEANVTGAAE